MYLSAVTRGFVLASIILAATQSQAGEVLKFVTGRIDLNNSVALRNLQNEKFSEYILQFKNTITEADKAWLKKSNIEVLRYVPDDAYLVKASEASLMNVLSDSRLNGFMGYASSLKLSPFLNAPSVFTKDTLERVIVKAFKAQEVPAILNQINSLDARAVVIASQDTSLVVDLPLSKIRRLAKIGGIEHIQAYVQMQTFDENPFDENAESEVLAGDYSDLNGFQSGTKVMKMDAAWALGFTGRGQIVAMADTGLDSGDVNNIHQDFKGGVIAGQAFGMFSKSWNDPMGHGTHVAGSVMGSGAASKGELKGAAYEAKMIGQGMWSPVLDNLSVPPKLGTMFEAAYKGGARVHTNSWGSARNFGAYDSFAQQVDEFMWNNPEMLILFAAGNSGVDMNGDGRIDEGSVSSPGTAKNALTVGASENLSAIGGIQRPVREMRDAIKKWPAEPIASDTLSNNENGIAVFSSRGPALDGRIKPEIVAPGTNILSVRSQVPGASPMWGEYNADYVFAGGTSMATPLTAGAAAVTRQFLIEKFQVAQPSAALVKATLLHSAKDLFPGQFGLIGADKGQELLTPRPNSDEGYGRVDMEKMVSLNGATTVLVDEKAGVAQGSEAIYEVTFNKSGKLLVNLAYTDAPALANAEAALVNNLDLEVVKVAGTQVVAQKTDKINNHEVVEMDVTSGKYQIKVKGVNIPQAKNGKLPFALVYSKFENAAVRSR